MFVLYLQTTTETNTFIYVHIYKPQRFNLGYILALLVPSREDLSSLDSEGSVLIWFGFFFFQISIACPAGLPTSGFFSLA